MVLSETVAGHCCYCCWTLRKETLRQTRTDKVGGLADSLVSHDLVHLARLLVDPRRLARLERREPGLDRLEDLLLRVQELERRLVLEAFKVDAVARLRTRGRVDKLDAAVFAVRRCCLERGTHGRGQRPGVRFTEASVEAK